MTITLPPLIALQRLSWQSLLPSLCLIVGYLSLMLFLQHPTSINVGQGWDGYYYYHMAAKADIETAHYTFKLRYGLPWLAGFFPSDDILLNFKLINLGCALLYAVCSYIILLRCAANMHTAVPIFGWGLLCMNNLAPIPAVFWYPIQTDIVCSLFALLFLMMVIVGRFPLWGLALLFFVGTAVRENFPEFLLYGLLRLQLSYDSNKNIRDNLFTLADKNRNIFIVLGTGLLASIAGLYSIFLYSGINPLSSRLLDIILGANYYINNPVRFLAVATNTISAVVFIIIAGWWLHHPVKYAEHLSGVPYAKLILLVFAVIALTGGTNTERFWYWSMPFFVLCTLPAINSLLLHKRYLLLGLCVLWVLFIQRALVPIDMAGIKKDCGLWAILNGQSNWLGHWADQCGVSAQRNLVLLAAAYAALILLLAAWPPLRNRRSGPSHLP